MNGVDALSNLGRYSLSSSTLIINNDYCYQCQLNFTISLFLKSK